MSREHAEVSTDRPGWAERVAGAVLAAPRRGPAVRVVAVEGRSGSGKSTVAEQLRLALAGRGEPVALLTMEDLYPGWGGLAESSVLLAEWVLLPLSRGGAAAWRRYDWERGCFGTEWEGLPAELVEGGGTLIVEGCGSGAAPVRDLVDLLVWVEVSEETRSERLDQREDAALYAPHRDRWARQEDALHSVDPPRERADLRLDNG
ncbi:uridine kinase family protein [Nocardiopsis valliformis]|uniref:uridine kinase family protein n=1 Tax=Nocardiopsis valliformis TaxID=239974 RepID=UPI0005853C4C|nr:phosphoribulokinase [Nocardiopsis valliformis]